MRELEFLPDWYPFIRKRKRVIVLQCWMFGAIAVGMLLWFVLVQRNIRMAESCDAMLRAQLHQTEVELTQIKQLDRTGDELHRQEEILASLGMHVQAGRVIGAVANAMPPQMSLLSLEFNVEETQPAAPATKLVAVTPERQRWIDVKVQGIAPSDVELTAFMTSLSNISFFDQVAVTYARELQQGTRVLREFQVTFRINLTQAPA